MCRLIQNVGYRGPRNFRTSEFRAVDGLCGGQGLAEKCRPSLVVVKPYRIRYRVSSMGTLIKTDYTRQPVGTEYEDGGVEKCPHCGKHRPARLEGEKRIYTHSQSISFNEQIELPFKVTVCSDNASL
jgi:hypothetical protein